ncbi:MAG: DUF3800 domain-containing protein [Chloroflexi bacterium]|nr:DUF3800 domain-containing protein [Chloroflexota bacterium]
MSHNVYIDESGDEGFQEGATRWFILGALIVPSALDLQTSTMIPRIKSKLGRDPKTPLHWSHVRSHDKRLYICAELLTEQWVFSCVISDKKHPTVQKANGLPEKWNLYFYSTRLLLERISWYVRDNGGGMAHLTFEKRTNMDYDAMNSYLRRLYGWIPPTQVSWSHIDWKRFHILPKEKSRLLQAADQVCGAVSDALEYTRLGNNEPRYVLELKERFYRRNGNLFSYGLKFLHCKGSPLREYAAEYPWLKTI